MWRQCRLSHLEGVLCAEVCVDSVVAKREADLAMTSVKRVSSRGARDVENEQREECML